MSKLQVGRYGELAGMLAFIAHGFDVYSTEVDERGVDFVTRRPDGAFYEVQVKALRSLDYTYMRKSVFPIRPSMLALLVLLLDGEHPALYLIPSGAWQSDNPVLVDRDYVGLKSQPEWGISLSRKHLHHLDGYRFELSIGAL